MNPLEGLKPAELWQFFKEVSSIPRCSGNEKAITEYILQKAQKAQLSVRQESGGNIIIKKPASIGYEKAPTVVLQSHLDMVCEKMSTAIHDFNKDSIKIIRKDGYIYADGTTLGADDGIGVAAMLAVMSDRNLAHGPLEFIFTVNEARNMAGAQSLTPESVQGRILLNLDSEKDGTLFIGCAGGIDTIGTLAVTWQEAPTDYRAITLTLSGLQGGHSGLEIHYERANAIKIMAFLVNYLLAAEALLVSFEGGERRNAIAREAFATVLLPETRASSILDHTKELFNCIKKEYSVVDPLISLAITNTCSQKTVLSSTSARTFIDLLLALPHGVLRMSPLLEGVVAISTNLARVYKQDYALIIETKQRAMTDIEKKCAQQSVEAVFRLANAAITTANEYHAWEPKFNTTLALQAQAVYKKLFGKDLFVTALHAGLECAVIAQKIPDMQMISFGPTIEGGHSPLERIKIDTVEPFWLFLVALLKDIAQRYT